MAERDEKESAVRSAKAFLEGLKNRPRQPWDDLHEEREAAPEPPPPPSAPSRPQAVDDPMSMAERIAKRNRDIAAKTRHLRKD